MCDMFHPPDAPMMLPWLLADPSGTFVDVGAHVGTFAVHAALFFKKVVAFEPEPRNLQCLKNNVTQNRIPNITVIPKAVSDQCGTATFHVIEGVDTGRNSLLPNGGGATFEVPTVTIDSVFSEQLRGHPPISYMKIDVEGFEPKVLKGAATTLGNQPNKPVLAVEFTPSRWAKNESDFLWLCDFLKANDYTPFFPTSGFLSPITIAVLAELYDCWKRLEYDSWVDLVFVPFGDKAVSRIPLAYGRTLHILSTMT